MALTPFGAAANTVAPNLAIVPKTELSAERASLQKGGVTDAGWYSENGSLRRKQPPLTKEKERELLGCIASVQKEFMSHVDEGRLDRVEDMLEFQAVDLDVNYQDPKDGKTPLMIASLANSVEIVEVLLEARADPHIRDRGEMRYTPLEAAQRIFEDEDAEFGDLVEILRVASGYDRLPRVRRSPYGERYEER